MISAVPLFLRSLNRTIQRQYSSSSSSRSQMMMPSRRSLVVFDFDHTLVDSDSYTAVTQMAPLPAHLQTLPEMEGWQEYMQQVLNFHHANKLTSAQIKTHLETLPMTKGMRELLLFLRAEKTHFDTVILSDANMTFIDWILQRHELVDCFTKILTNPAEVDAEGRWRIGSYHRQTECRLSPVNMCKGRILGELMEEFKGRNHGKEYQAVYYVGDGENDLCPGQRLTSNDVFFVRRGFALAKKLLDSHVKCTVELWSDGEDILRRLRSLT